MTFRSTKPARCKHCKVRMPEDEARHVLHEECKDPWIAKQLAKQAAARLKKQKDAAKADRVVRQKRREAIETIPELIKAAQKEFNAFIRERDRDQPCICCGNPLGKDSIGGGFDCGHYRSTGSASHLRFDERNAHAQRKHCNRYGAGRAVDYRIGLIARIGLPAVEALEADNEVIKWDRDTLRQIKVIYRAKVRELKKRNA